MGSWADVIIIDYPKAFPIMHWKDRRFWCVTMDDGCITLTPDLETSIEMGIEDEFQIIGLIYRFQENSIDFVINGERHKKSFAHDISLQKWVEEYNFDLV